MSNALAIATVTAALRKIAVNAAREADESADVIYGRPEAPTNGNPSRVRLYLYLVAPNAALRNADLPTRNANHELIQRPQIALDLHYLLAFYGDEPKLLPQRMMGAVVRDFHARSMLRRSDIRAVIDGTEELKTSDLADAIEQVKLSPLPLSTEEMSKLWSVFFQTPHALSVAYQASVVLITGTDGAQQARPVLRRGEDDRGPEAEVRPFPLLDSIHIGLPEQAELRPRPASFRAVQLGHQVRLKGLNLTEGIVSVQFVHQRVHIQNELPVSNANQTSTEILVTLPDDDGAQTAWAIGLYSVSFVYSRPGENELRKTSVLPLALAPRIKSIEPTSSLENPIQPTTVGQNKHVTLTIKVSPNVVKSQKATILLSTLEVPANPFAEDADGPFDTLTFKINNPPRLKAELVTLRIDGVDSLPFILEPPDPQHPEKPRRLIFDPAQMVTINE